MHGITPRACATLLLLAGAVFAPNVHAAFADDAAPADKQLNQLYWQGQEALKQSDWNAALQRFKDLETRMRTSEPQGVDSALYWQAYTLAQAKRTTEAKSQIDRLHKEFPQSRWGKQADALVRKGEPTVEPGKGTPAKGDDDEDMAELAVEGLMNAPAERALPLLKKVLASKHSQQVKKRALFVLSQLDSPEAYAIVAQTAKGEADPELREESIRMLGISGDHRAEALLQEIYSTSKDPKERRNIIQAWLTADRKDLVLAAARKEPDRDTRMAAIQVLGAMDASAELKQLFDTESDADARTTIIHSLGVAGDTAALLGIAQTSKDENSRLLAIQSLGISGDDEAVQALLKVYRQAGDQKTRDAVLQGLLVAGEIEPMLALYKEAKTKQEKQALFRMISIQGDGAALNLIEAELDKK